MSVDIRLAVEADVADIYQLLTLFVEKNILIPRSKEEIQKELQCTWVAQVENHLVGCVNITSYSGSLKEVRGLAVANEYHGKNIGRKLVEASLLKFENEPEVRVFALTYVPTFFEQLGFRRVSKDAFPDKIYDDCQYCLRKHDCQEIAVEKYFNKEVK